MIGLPSKISKLVEVLLVNPHACRLESTYAVDTPNTSGDPVALVAVWAVRLSLGRATPSPDIRYAERFPQFIRVKSNLTIGYPIIC